MPEPERSIEDLVEDLVEAVDASATMWGGGWDEQRVRAARDTLLRAVARLREENERLRALAEAVRELYTDTPKGGGRE